MRIQNYYNYEKRIFNFNFIFILTAKPYLFGRRNNKRKSSYYHRTGINVINSLPTEIITTNIFNISGLKVASIQGTNDNIQLPNGVYIKENIYNTGEKLINKIIY